MNSPRIYLSMPDVVQHIPPTDDTAAAFELGRTGATATDAERRQFEAWMAGHCWACALWDGKSYTDGTTRVLWAAWRDRAALAQQGEPVAQSVWKLVPVEPTAAMIQAAGPRWVDQSNTYRAMVASAPQPAPVAQPLNLGDKSVQKRLAAQWGFVPAAQPLTDEQAHDVVKQWRSQDMSLHIDLVRAVERAHGIGGKE